MNLAHRVSIRNITKSFLITFMLLGLVISLPSYADKDKNTKRCHIYKQEWGGPGMVPGKPNIERVEVIKEQTAKQCCEACRRGRESVMGDGNNVSRNYAYCGGKDCDPFRKTPKTCTDEPWYNSTVDCNKAKY